ncbi:MAG: hypothetical protein SGBAC_002931 [Bacillariaceae sp.]
MPDEVIELSIEETNKLRAELGLAPLRLDKPIQSFEEQASHNDSTESASKTEEVLELSVDETNKLREKLGLKPLRSGAGKEEVHKPATNDRSAQEAAERIKQARLRRDVQRGATKTFGSQTLADEADKSALSWAEKIRQQKDEAPKKSKAKKKAKTNERYDDNDLDGMQVSHKMSELEAGSTTVLTLADAPLLAKNESNKATGLNEAEDTLENDNLREQKQQQDGLRKKRMLEMGMGRAGGYAGFDDEEFEELGGSMGPSRRERGNQFLEGEDENQPAKLGFRLGSKRQNEEKLTDFDAIQQGKAISLLPSKADMAASDYMTVEEEEAERAKRKKKKDGKFKKKKKKDKKSKKQRRRKVESDDEEETTEALGTQNVNLLQHLEETASAEVTGMRKRRKVEDEESNDETMTDDGVKQETKEKRARYDEIMAKGNERTRLAFQEKKKPKVEEDVFDEEPDDSFLNEALAKARRLNRLRELNKPKAKGAEAVAAALKKSEEAAIQPENTISSSSGISFSVDDTREFTRAIQARAQQEERSKAKPAPNSSGIKIEIKSTSKATKPKVEDVEMKEAEEDEDEGNLDIHELAKEVEDDGIPTLEGTASEAAGVGRGLSSFVSMLKQTGEISKKNTGKEELRGRAKDERNYENYEALDLSKVVKIGRNATDKDKEFADREIKLEYRDKHGRLLTSKEAYRDLCYQFHGNGGSKKKEDKRLRQIQREQAEARMASRQVTAAREGTTAGTLGALKATQKATGKAFIVHKT